MCRMIEETVRYSCRSCGSPNIIRNGTNKCGNPQYHCRDCGAYRVLRPKEQYTAAHKAQVLRWLRAWVAQLPSLENTLLPAEAGDVLKMDDVVSFVGEKFFQRWLWTAQCRSTCKSLSFSKTDTYMELVTRWFILEHNLRIRLSLTL
jgi:uncharacterized Zn finger protein